MRGGWRNLIASERIDIVHAQSAGAAWSALAATDRMPVFLVTRSPTGCAADSWPGTLFRGSLARGDRVIAPSSYVSRAMIERYKIPPERITVIPRAVDTAAFSPAAVSADRIAALRRAWGILPQMRVVLVPGRIAPWNGQMSMIDAARLLVGGGDRNIAFVFAGEDRGQPRYARSAAPAAPACTASTRSAAWSAIAPTCRPRSPPPMSWWCRRWSRRCPGRAAAEAQAMGRPVVATTVGVLPENVLCPPRMRDELRTGWLVRPGNVGELARAIAPRSRSTSPPTRRSAPARANSPNSCFPRKALPKPFAAFIRRCWLATPDADGFEVVNVMSSSPAPEMPAVKDRPSAVARGDTSEPGSDGKTRAQQTRDPITVLIVVPTLDGGAADVGALGLVRILTAAGHRAIVASQAGRLVADVTAAGGEFVAARPRQQQSASDAAQRRRAEPASRASANATRSMRSAAPAAWSAYLAARLRGIPFVTSWYKGFRDQNIFKHLYNGVMARGDRVVAVSEQIAQLINDRYGTPWERIAVVPSSIDFERFDPAEVARERVEAMRHAWGVKRDTKVILIVGRIVRRKGHHVVVKAAKRLKEMGFKDFLCVFVGEDRGRTHYTGELWDLVLATGTMDVIRMAAPVADMPAAYAAASVVVSAAVQPEGLQRSILEAQAMARPVIVSDLGAGPDVVLTPPAVPENRITGLRFHSGDDAALAATLLRLFSLPEPARRAMGARGRDWVLGHFNAPAVAEQTLRLYDEITGRERAPALVPRLRQN